MYTCNKQHSPKNKIHISPITRQHTEQTYHNLKKKDVWKDIFLTYTWSRGMLIRKKRREKRLGKVLMDGINNEKEETKVPGTTVSTDEGKSEASTKSDSKADEEVEVTQQEQ